MAKVLIPTTYFLGMPTEGCIAFFSGAGGLLYTSKKQAGNTKDMVISYGTPEMKNLKVYEITAIEAKEAD